MRHSECFKNIYSFYRGQIMLKKWSLILSILLCAVSISCNKSDSPISGNDNNLGIYGQVVGAHNKPIYEDFSTGSIKKTTPTTLINFSIPERSTVFLYILRYGTQDTLAVLINGDELNAGVYSVNFDENKLTNGVYTYPEKYASLKNILQ